MIKRFAQIIVERLSELELIFDRSVITMLFQTVHTASLITEEGKFVQGSVTLSNPLNPDTPPRTRRASYPAIHPLGNPLKLTPESFAKLARAVDKWSGSVAVWGESSKKINAWGIVDQLVGTNTLLNREAEGGFANPGILTVVIDRPGDLTAYHGDMFLGSFRAQKIILSESEPFYDPAILEKVGWFYEPFSKAIVNSIKNKIESDADEEIISNSLLSSWGSVASRICIGLQRLGTGGALIFSPQPLDGCLSIGYKFNYERLSTSLVLDVLDKYYLYALETMRSEAKKVGREFLWNLSFAQADVEDRQDELRGAVKLVTSLAAMDGAVLLTPGFQVVGFGVKISATEDPDTVYDGEDFFAKGTKARKISTASFGTRHGSMLRYCRADPLSIGIIISQDGHVKVVTTSNGSLIMWDRLQLLSHSSFTPEQVSEFKSWKAMAENSDASESLGYSEMPKTCPDLLNYL